MKDDGTYKYIVYKQPLSLDRLYVHDILPTDAQGEWNQYDYNWTKHYISFFKLTLDNFPS